MVLNGYGNVAMFTVIRRASSRGVGLGTGACS